MIKIKSVVLKKFLEYAGKVKGKNIMPVLDFIELKCNGDAATLTKSNMSQFCQCTIDIESDEGEVTYLLEEEIIKNLVSGAHGEEVVMKYDPKTVRLMYNDGVSKMHHGVLDKKSTEVFPAFPQADSDEKFELPEEFIDYIRLATCVLTKEPELPTSYIFVQPNGNGTRIDSTDRKRLYHNKVDKKLPAMVMTPEICDIIHGESEWNYGSSESFHFFENINVRYACVKSDQKPFPFEVLTDPFGKDHNVVFSREALVSFCQKAIKIAPTAKVEDIQFTEVKLSIENDQMVCCYSDDALNRGHDAVIPVTNNAFGLRSANFNAVQLLQLLKSIPHPNMGFAMTKNAPNSKSWYLFTPDEETYIGMIQELNPLSYA